MKAERFKRTKSVVASCAIALVVAAATFGVSSVVVGQKSAPQHLGFDLTSGGSSFTIQSTFYKTPSGAYPAASCSGSGALVPGGTLCVVFNVTNLLNVPISVTGITGALDSSHPTPPSECMGSYLTLPIFSGSFSVPASGSANSPGVPITLQDSTTVDQTPCAGFHYYFTYSGTAQYTDSTSTALTSSPNPSLFGQSVTFTATVSANNPATDAYKPTGSVTFYECTTAACTGTKTALTGAVSIVQSTGKASFSTTALSLGTHYLDAVYSPADATNFMTSSGLLTQTVGLPATCDHSTHNGGYTVTRGQSICLTGRVNGGLTVQSGGAVYLSGVTVNGGITSTGATAIRICGTSVGGNVSVTSSTGFVMISDDGDDGTPACAGNTFSANVTLTNNTGGFEFGGNTTTASGSVTITGNVTSPLGEGVAEVEANTISGNLSCSGNTPTPTNDAHINHVSGTQPGPQCAPKGTF